MSILNVSHDHMIAYNDDKTYEFVNVPRTSITCMFCAFFKANRCSFEHEDCFCCNAYGRTDNGFGYWKLPSISPQVNNTQDPFHAYIASLILS